MNITAAQVGSSQGYAKLIKLMKKIIMIIYKHSSKQEWGGESGEGGEAKAKRGA